MSAGKILVIFNMAVSFLFLGFAIMVCSTRVDLRAQLNQEKSRVSALTTEKGSLQTKCDDLEKQKADEDTKLKKITADNEQQKTTLQGQIAQLQEEINKSKQESATAITQMQGATSEQTQRRGDVEQLRNTRNGLLAKNAEIVGQKTTLQDQLSQVTNDLRLANDRNRQLVDRLKQFEGR
jgi:chromosome segregation ATPase